MRSLTYQENLIETRLDIQSRSRSRKKRDPKDIKCKKGQKVRGAVCQDIEKTPQKSNKLAETLINTAIAAAVTTGIKGISNNKTTQEAISRGLNAVNKIAENLPETVNLQIGNIVNSAANEFDSLTTQKQSPLAKRIAKEVFIQTSASLTGIAAAGAGFIGGSKATKAATKNSPVSLLVGAGVGLRSHRIAKEHTEGLLRKQFGSGFQDPQAQKLVKDVVSGIEYGTLLAVGGSIAYAKGQEKAGELRQEGERIYEDLKTEAKIKLEEIAEEAPAVVEREAKRAIKKKAQADTDKIFDKLDRIFRPDREKDKPFANRLKS